MTLTLMLVVPLLAGIVMIAYGTGHGDRLLAASGGIVVLLVALVWLWLALVAAGK